jgi:ATP/maltotriose-dependent transcriptional regulator MalT
METGEFATAQELLEEALERAAASGETTLGADATVTLLLARRRSADDLDAWSGDVIDQLGHLIPQLEQAQAHDELAKAWRLLGYVHGSVLNWRELLEAHGNAIANARLAGDTRLEARLLAEYASGLRDGPTPVDEAVRHCEEALERGLADRQAEAFVCCSLARLRAMAGDFDVARELILRAGRLRDELGASVIVPLTSLQSSRVESLAGDFEAAERDLRRDYQKLSGLGEKYVLPLVGTLLARAICAQGRFEEAAELTAQVESLADPDDVETQAILHCVTAQLQAHRGDLAAAEQAARDAVNTVVGIESPDLRGDCVVTVAQVLAEARRPDEARAALTEALDLYVLKGNLVSAGRTERLLESLPMLAEKSA